jgi:uncharacterized membrane protein (UPF0127 family)
MRLDLLAQQLDAQAKINRSDARRESQQLRAKVAEAERAIGLQIRLGTPESSPMLFRPGSTN